MKLARIDDCKLFYIVIDTMVNKTKVIHSYSNLADWVLDFLLSFFKTFTADCSFLAIAFAMDFFFRSFLDLFISLPFFTFLFHKKGTVTCRSAWREKQQVNEWMSIFFNSIVFKWFLDLKKQHKRVPIIVEIVKKEFPAVIHTPSHSSKNKIKWQSKKWKLGYIFVTPCKRFQQLVTP